MSRHDAQQSALARELSRAGHDTFDLAQRLQELALDADKAGRRGAAAAIARAKQLMDRAVIVLAVAGLDDA